VTACPNCGAPVDLKAANASDDSKCPFCQYALPVEAPPQAPVGTFTPAPGGIFAPAPVTISTGRRSGCAGPIVMIVVVVAIGGGILAAVLAASGSASKIGNAIASIAGSSYTVTTPVVPVPGGGAAFYAIAPSAGSTNNVVRRVDPIGHHVVWSSPVLSTSASDSTTVVAGATEVFAISDDNVVALDPATGHQDWRASLSNGLASPCDSGCAVVAGNDLVALSKDGTVQAFNTATGAQAWSKRLNSTPRWLEAAAGTVLTDDTVGGSGADLDVLAINAATGATHMISPTCPADPDDPEAGPVTPDDESGFFVTPDGTGLVTMITNSPGCVVRNRIADGAVVWRTPPATDSGPIPDSLTGNSILIGAMSLFWTSDADVYAATLSTGAVHKLLTDSRDDVTLDGSSGSTLVLTEAPKFDSNEASTAGVNAATGQQLWQIASRVKGDVTTQDVAVSPSGPVVISCNETADTCLFEAVNPTTGTIAGSVTVPADPADTEEVHAVVGTTSLFVTAGWDHVVGIDPTDAAVTWKWPS